MTVLPLRGKEAPNPPTDSFGPPSPLNGPTEATTGVFLQFPQARKSSGFH